ncbi:MAG: transposase [Sphingobium sp.]|nr:transposase [Sphingobium sp.]
MTSHVEVVGGRRRWTVDQKLVILRDAFGPGGSVRDACRQHNIGNGQIYTWRRQAFSGELAGVTPAMQPDFAEVRLDDMTVSYQTHPSGLIGIELPSGIKLTVDSLVDAGALSRVMSVLTR